jgi:transcriptional regulator GlxA family with amidase domain
MDPRVQVGIRLVEESRACGVTVTALAGRVGLSRSRFEHLFRTETGLTAKDFVRRTRLTAAKDLLGNWTLSVKQVAAKVGYRYCPDFCRDFREEFGVTATQYRRRLTERGVSTSDSTLP